MDKFKLTQRYKTNPIMHPTCEQSLYIYLFFAESAVII
jgi:hypothetical protein